MSNVLLRKYATAIPSTPQAKRVIKITLNALSIVVLYVLNRLKQAKDRTKKIIKHEYFKKPRNKSK
jgi:hypothetical protein